MKEIALVALGWFLGLFSPLIVEGIKNRKTLRLTSDALRIELDDLQFRLAIVSLSLLQRHGRLTPEFLAWLKPIIARYAGNEKSDAIKTVVEKLRVENDPISQTVEASFRAKPGEATSLSSFHAPFLEAHLERMSDMPVGLQRKIHEFRNQLTILNQEVALIEPRILMTYNPNLGENNLVILSDELESRYNSIQRRCRWAAERIESILIDL